MNKALTYEAENKQPLSKHPYQPLASHPLLSTSGIISQYGSIITAHVLSDTDHILSTVI